MPMVVQFKIKRASSATNTYPQLLAKRRDSTFYQILFLRKSQVRRPWWKQNLQKHCLLNMGTRRKYLKRKREVDKPIVIQLHGESSVDDGVRRRWNEMPYDIMVNIMKRSSHLNKTYYLKSVCKSWRLALLDSLFAPGDVLDLRLFDQLPHDLNVTRKVYWKYLWKLLNHRQYTKLFLPQFIFEHEIYKDLAKRLPALKCVVVHINLPVDVMLRLTGMFRYWSKLMEAHCHACLVRRIAVHCKQIQKLCLYGWIRDEIAKVIANQLPQLEHLDIQSCVLSCKALTMILDGQKELKHLDTRHAARFDDKFLSRFGPVPFGKAIDWNDEEICPMVVGIGEYFECPRKNCPDCGIFYDLSVSQHGLRAWSLHLLTCQPHRPGPCSYIPFKCDVHYSPDLPTPVSCFLRKYGMILPVNFRPIEDDSWSGSMRNEFFVENVD